MNAPQVDLVDNAHCGLTHYRPLTVGGYRTGALDIRLANRRVLSIPTQLGCPVGCPFCVSGQTSLVRNLSCDEMARLVQTCLNADADTRPLELSFTGEGEPSLNWKQAALLVDRLPRLDERFNSVRYSFSGLGAPQLLGKLHGGTYPMRLQFSLHSARAQLRGLLVPNSEPLSDIAVALQHFEHRFAAIELNVVLQDGVNDSDADLDALARWGSRHWPILLNPLLQDGQERVGARTQEFAHALRARGRTVHCYRHVAAAISRTGVYPLLASGPLAHRLERPKALGTPT